MYGVKVLVIEALVLSEEMGRTPCCDKKGLKKGPWTPEEDEILIQYIKKNGHGSWRSLPKLAGFIFLSFFCTHFYAICLVTLIAWFSSFFCTKTTII